MIRFSGVERVVKDGRFSSLLLDVVEDGLPSTSRSRLRAGAPRQDSSAVRKQTRFII